MILRNIRAIIVKKLKGLHGYRIRKGHNRIIYDIHDYMLIVYVVAIWHRKDIYE